METVVSNVPWTGESLQESSLWGYTLDRSEISELVEALHYFKKSGYHYAQIETAEIQKSMFPLPEKWTTLLESVRSELEDGTGAVMLRNLPVDQFDENDMAIIHSGISKYVGNIVCQAGGRVRSGTRGHGKYVGKVVAEMGGSVPMHGKQSNNKFLLHTDVCDSISLLCYRNASTEFDDGGSIIASALAIHNEMMKESPELVKELFKPVPRLWTVSRSLYCDMPIWRFYGNGNFTTQLTPVYTEVSQLVPNSPTVTKMQVTAMNKLQEIGYRIGLKFSLRPGDCYFLNNHLAYHGRQAWKYDPKQPASRVLLRTWLSPYKNRALPDEAAYAELWGSTAADRPRGRAHLGTEDPDALNTLNTLNARIGELISEGKYDYFDLYNDYDRFMINIGRKNKDTDTGRLRMVNASRAR